MEAKSYEKLFRKNVIMTISQLMSSTGQPRESILRDIRAIGYYSSYNERGRYYTLSKTPAFDELGLWKYQKAFFSNRRTLLDTAEYLIKSSTAGHTHADIRQMLGIAAHNSLYQLVMAGKVERRQIGGQYVYFGKDNASIQIANRNAMPAGQVERRASRNRAAQGVPGIAPTLVIDILVAALRGHGTDTAAHSYLSGAGSPITQQQVSAVFRHYGIGKKNSPARK